MIFNRNPSQSPQTEPAHSYPARHVPVSEIFKKRLEQFVLEHSSLFEACLVAVSAHLLAFPLVWFIGWALPWPKSPIITTIIELDLSNWPEEAVPKEISEIYESAKRRKK